MEWNANELLSCKYKLQENISTENLDKCLISETYLINESDLQFSNYKMYHAVKATKHPKRPVFQIPAIRKLNGTLARSICDTVVIFADHFWDRFLSNTGSDTLLAFDAKKYDTVIPLITI